MFQQPKYEAIGEAGLAGFQYGKPIQQGGQPQSFAPPKAGPPPGQEVGEYRFKGGDPNDRSNWEPVAQGGGGPRVTSNFLDGVQPYP